MMHQLDYSINLKNHSHLSKMLNGSGKVINWQSTAVISDSILTNGKMGYKLFQMPWWMSARST